MMLLRHGAPLTKERCYGRTDPPLRDTPRHTAMTLRPRLHGRRRLICSPSPRCRELAEALTDEGNVIVAEELMELDFGAWEGLPWSQIPREALDEWARRPLDFTAPGGESARDLLRRVDAWVRRFEPKSDDLIVAHAGSLRALAACLLNTEFETTWQWPVPYATPLRLIDIDTGFQPTNI